MCIYQITDDDFRINRNKSVKYISEKQASEMLNISVTRLHWILKELNDSEYVTVIYYKDEPNIEYAFLNEKGKMFKESGGYKHPVIEWIEKPDNIWKIVVTILIPFLIYAWQIGLLHKIQQFLSK